MQLLSVPLVFLVLSAGGGSTREAWLKASVRVNPIHPSFCGILGGGAQPPPRGSPRATFWRASSVGAIVSVTLTRICVAGCLLCSHWCLLLLFVVLFGNLRTAKCWDTTFGVLDLCRVSCPLFAPPGAVPVVGGYLYPSVLRSPGATPQKCRAAHGPLHPAVTSPPRLCWFCIWFLVRFLWDGCWVFCLVFFLSLGLEWCLVCCPSGPDPCYAQVFVVPSFSFLVVWLVSSTPFFSLLFLSGAGETQTFWFGFPLVFSSSCPRTTTSTRTPCSSPSPRPSPAPVFFSFFVASLVRWWSVAVCGLGSSLVWVVGCSGWVVFLGARWLSLVVGFCMLCRQVLMHCRSGQKD